MLMLGRSRLWLELRAHSGSGRLCRLWSSGTIVESLTANQVNLVSDGVGSGYSQSLRNGLHVPRRTVVEKQNCGVSGGTGDGCAMTSDLEDSGMFGEAVADIAVSLAPFDHSRSDSLSGMRNGWQVKCLKQSIVATITELSFVV